MSFLKFLDWTFRVFIAWPVFNAIIARNARMSWLLGKYLERGFAKTVYITHVTVRNHLKPGFNECENHKLFWEAPLAITFWRDEHPLLAISFDFFRGTLYIRQLQGVAGSRVPQEIADWPKRLVRRCVAFSRIVGIRRVRLARAHVSVFYYFPDLDWELDGVSFKEAKKALRMRLRRRYDGTGRSLGFRSLKRWTEWEHPKWAATR